MTELEDTTTERKRHIISLTIIIRSMGVVYDSPLPVPHHPLYVVLPCQSCSPRPVAEDLSRPRVADRQENWPGTQLKSRIGDLRKVRDGLLQSTHDLLNLDDTVLHKPKSRTHSCTCIFPLGGKDH